MNMDTQKLARVTMILQFTHQHLFNDDDDEYESERIDFIPKIFGFAEDVVPFMNNGQFKQHFRMTASTFEIVLNMLYSVHSIQTVGQPQVEFGKQLMITVWFLANLECLRSIASRFGVSKSTCWHVIHRVCTLLLKVNQKFKVISWPSTSRANEITASILRNYHFPGVIGIIDGTHIPINAPHQYKMSYFNRNSYFSVLLQGVCDHERKFIDVYAGQPGSVHDNAVLEKSDLYIRMQNSNTHFPNNGHLLGDLAYKLTPTLLIGFKNLGHLTRRQKNYNHILSQTRVLIEHSFALLKGRFRRLKLLETRRNDLIPIIIVTSCILHNICIMQSDILENLDIEDEIRQLREEDANELYEENEGNAARGKRLDIVQNLPLLRQYN